MPFSSVERSHLLSVKGVGPKVIDRLEQLGFSTLKNLAEADAREITQAVSQDLGSTCWKNSPLAPAAITNAIEMARRHTAQAADSA